MPLRPSDRAHFKKAEYAGSCERCRVPFKPGAVILWCPDTRGVWCLDCGELALDGRPARGCGI